MDARCMHEPKTSHSRRTLRMPKQTDAALHAHRDRQDFDKQKAGDAWHDSGLVFCTGIGTPLDQGLVKLAAEARRICGELGWDTPPSVQLLGGNICTEVGRLSYLSSPH